MSDDVRAAARLFGNDIIYDNVGYYSVVVPIVKQTLASLGMEAPDETHPAFIVDGVEKDVIWVSKYHNIIVNDRAYSLPMKDPATNISFDRALTVCRNKGVGWHLTSNALWAAIALWCKKNNTMPHGNNNYGQDISTPHEKGVPTYKETSGAFRTLRTATGSGPVSWYHNYADSGIADLNGNVWEWVSGMRLNNGEIQIIPYANAMKLDCNMSESSTEWKAILPDGSLVNPGTVGTLKWDFVAGKITLATAITMPAGTQRTTTFETLGLASDATAPALLKALGIHPHDVSGYEGDATYMVNNGERLPIRGGRWHIAAGAGVFALHLGDVRSRANMDIGFRAAYYEP